MPGYSGKALVDKLGVKAGHRVALLDAPDETRSLLAPLPAGVRFVAPEAGLVDVALLFTRAAAHLEQAFVPAARTLAPGGMLWVAWPKRASGVATDVTEDVVRRVGLAAGLVDVKVCAVTDVWSGLKFVRRRA